MEYLRKLTIKTCGDFTTKKIKDLLATRGEKVEVDVTNADGTKGRAFVPGPVKPGEAVQLLKIAGNVSNAKTGQTQLGMFTRLSGSFIGTDLTTGEMFQSGQCILPDFIGAVLGDAALRGGNVQFGVLISAKRDDDAVAGYTYSVKPLIDTKPSPEMEKLMQATGMLALPPADAPADLPAQAPPAENPAPSSKKGK